MTEQNKRRIRAAVFLLLALGLADAAWRGDMNRSWFRHGSADAHEGGMPGPDLNLAGAPPAPSAAPANQIAPTPTLSFLPTNHKGADGAARPAHDLEIASASPDDNDLLSGTGSLDSISPSAGVAGAPPTPEPSGDSAGAPSDAPAVGGAGGETGSGGTNTGTTGGGTGGGTGDPILGIPPVTGGGGSGSGTGNGTGTGTGTGTGAGTGDGGGDGGGTGTGTGTNPGGPSDPGGGTASPVPEPSTLGMMALGALAIFARRQRKPS